MSNTREQVLDEIAKVIRLAQDSGQGSGLDVARRRFPGTPLLVLVEAETRVDMERTEEWWTAVERTIDGAVIRNSIVKLEGRQHD